MSSRKIAEHYNTHRPRSQTSDELVQIRSFHNYVKARLIADACSAVPSPIRFLDLCCGNGGDIGKVAHQNVTHYFGIDIASDAVKRACERLNASPLEGDVIEFNAFTSTCGNMLFHMKKFDVVSCQFAIHYAFGSETTARLFIQNVAFALRNGGRFIGTLPDEQHLRVARQHLGKRFGDQFHSIRFNDTTSTFEDFGSSYQFSFKGAVNDLEEFIVKPSVLERLCADCGMKLVEWKRFADFAKEKSPQNTLWNRMGCTFEPVSNIYTTFHFVMDDQDKDDTE